MNLSNDIITIEVAEHGAELVSLNKGEREYFRPSGQIQEKIRTYQKKCGNFLYISHQLSVCPCGIGNITT